MKFMALNGVINARKWVGTETAILISMIMIIKMTTTIFEFVRHSRTRATDLFSSTELCALLLFYNMLTRRVWVDSLLSGPFERLKPRSVYGMENAVKV